MFATITLVSNVSTIAEMAAFVGTYVDRPIFEMAITSTRISIARIVVAVDDEDIQEMADNWCSDYTYQTGSGMIATARYGK